MIDMLHQEWRVISLTVPLSIVMTSPGEFLTGEFRAKQV